MNAATQKHEENPAVGRSASNGELGLKKTAKERFYELGADEEMNPLERLRFFCCLALTNPQDWLDIEPFFDDVQKQMDDAKRHIERRTPRDGGISECHQCGVEIPQGALCASCWSSKSHNRACA